LRSNLLSIPTALICGWSITNTGVNNTLTKQQGDEYGQLVFDTIDPDTTSIVIIEKFFWLTRSSKKEFVGKQQQTHDLALDFCTMN
jgi:hypothetical protein